MCVYSMVADYFRPQFEPWTQPGAPSPAYIPTPLPDQTSTLAKLIEDFKAAIEAAKKVDALTGQPNCEDPEKAKLVERVAALEKEIAGLRKPSREGKRRPAGEAHRKQK